MITEKPSSFCCIFGCLPFTFYLINSLSLLLHSLEKKNKLNISDFYSNILSFRSNIMCAPTIFDQTDCFRTARYNSASSDEYLSDSSSCTDNRSDLGSDDHNDYESNYES